MKIQKQRTCVGVCCSKINNLSKKRPLIPLSVFFFVPILFRRVNCPFKMEKQNRHMQRFFSCFKKSETEKKIKLRMHTQTLYSGLLIF